MVPHGAHPSHRCLAVPPTMRRRHPLLCVVLAGGHTLQMHKPAETPPLHTMHATVLRVRVLCAAAVRRTSMAVLVSGGEPPRAGAALRAQLLHHSMQAARPQPDEAAGPSIVCSAA